LTLIELKPKQSERVSDLKKQIISLDISGAENFLWLFLQTLFHQNALIEIIKLVLCQKSFFPSIN
jgi:hypothetical protein